MDRGKVYTITGSIPAWAGEPFRAYVLKVGDMVYPRVGGGTRHGRCLTSMPRGLSPRGRGNLRSSVVLQRRRGSIPAWAGEPSPTTESRSAYRVYPRVGGGTQDSGTPGDGKFGLSPRGRGNRSALGSRAWRRGSIPAWAGEPRPTRPRGEAPTVYPRVGGGTIPPAVSGDAGHGLSPRGRGNPAREIDIGDENGSIPAWAGEPSLCGPECHPRWVYPRVGGGTVPRLCLHPQTWGLSPRGRGNLGWARSPWWRCGSIPAWAGEPSAPSLCGSLLRVYPRVGGGTSIEGETPFYIEGLSPRGRGNHAEPHHQRLYKRSIPAWAGEPCLPSG